MSPQHVVVTGAAGFIGSHLCEALLAKSWHVTGVDIFDDFYDPVIKRQNIQVCLNDSRFSLIEADIRDIESMDALLGQKPDAVIHLAARAGVRPSIEQPLLYQEVNVHGTCVLMEAVRKHRINRFIFGSSSSVYGNNLKVPFAETDPVDYPISPYAATKRAGELICHTYHHLFGLNVTCLRFFTVYGPRQRPDLAIHKFARLIEHGKPIPFFGDGSMRRDYTYIDDIVAGSIAALERCEGYHIYNLGNATPVSLWDLVAAIEKALGKKAVIEKHPLQPGDAIQTFADITRAGTDLGYRPRINMATGLKNFVTWLRSTQGVSNESSGLVAPFDQGAI